MWAPPAGTAPPSPPEKSKLDTVPKPALGPGYILTDWAGAGFDLPSENWVTDLLLRLLFPADWEHQLSYMVCQRFCRPLTFQRHGRFFVYECCDKNYCNFKL